MRPPQSKAKTTSACSPTWTPGGCVFATEGRDASIVARFAADLAAHGGDPTQVHTTSSDMSAAFIAGITEHLPNAALTLYYSRGFTLSGRPCWMSSHWPEAVVTLSDHFWVGNAVPTRITFM